ncbi:hypothetical protein [Pseudomonas fluorescens]|uniref:hypothetical protein n=1 Tax=Pseudomonas fluorescens TaxID=294 RepID=UPI001241D562|nr:hypothetical protein [Pseudomonas fluorescens]VVN09909.1 hypothetical protein PS639_03732 [Pseudomonas fluorescens]
MQKDQKPLQIALGILAVLTVDELEHVQCLMTRLDTIQELRDDVAEDEKGQAAADQEQSQDMDQLNADHPLQTEAEEIDAEMTTFAYQLLERLAAPR